MLLTFSQTRSMILVCSLAVLPVLVLAGCGGKAAPEPAAVDAAAPTTESADEPEDEQPAAASTTKKVGSKKKTTVKKPTTPNVDGIPLDVFYDRPLQVAADKTTGAAPAVASTTPAATTDASPAKAPTDTPKPAATPAAAGGDSWDKVVTVEALLEEMKATRNQFQQRLTNVQAYNGAQLEMPVFGTELVLLAEVAKRHPGEIRWKKDAKFIRTMGAEVVKIASGADGKGKKAYDTINKNFLKVCELLDGNNPPELPDSPDDVSLEEVIDIKYLMKRLERAEETLKNNAATEANLEKNASLASRESVVYAIIGHIIKDKSFGYDSEDDYLKQADGMRDAGKGMQQAATGKNFAEFDALRNAASKRCSDCHMTYRTGK